MKAFGKIIQTIFMTALIAVVLLLTLPFIPYDFGLELRIVESGSMEPAIPTGALVAIYPAAEYGVSDVITFESTFADVPTTHRVMDAYMENGRTWFITKGDANEEADSAAVPLGDVLGKVWLSVPYVGFVLDFARQPLGFALLIVLPALAIIVGELEKIWKELRGRRRDSVVATEEAEPRRFSPSFSAPKTHAPAASPAPRPMMDIHTPVRYRMLPTLDLRRVTPRTAMPGHAMTMKRNWFGFISVLLVGTLIFGAGMLGTTVSYVVDTESALDNYLETISLDVAVSADDTEFTHNGEFDDDDISLTITPEADSVETRFNVRVEMTGGNDDLCDAIDADTTDPFSYSGPIQNLSEDSVLFTGLWDIEFALNDEPGFTNGLTCEVDIVLTAWYIDSESDEGYFDEERVALIFTYLEEVVEQALEVQAFTTQSLTAPVEATEEEQQQGTEEAEESAPKSEEQTEGDTQGEDDGGEEEIVETKEESELEEKETPVENEEESEDEEEESSEVQVETESQPAETVVE